SGAACFARNAPRCRGILTVRPEAIWHRHHAPCSAAALRLTHDRHEPRIKNKKIKCPQSCTSSQRKQHCFHEQSSSLRLGIPGKRQVLLADKPDRAANGHARQAAEYRT